MSPTLIAMAVLGITGLLAALLLYIVAKRFAVEEDPRIEQVEAILPGANCGACGRKGCHDFAVACCSADSLDGLYCPGAGADGMAAIASLLGLAATAQQKRCAFLRCNGGKCNRLVTSSIIAADIRSCALAATKAVPEKYCQWGCLGCGDCVEACRFDAIRIDATTGLPVVDGERCTACGGCVKACPQMLLFVAGDKPEGNVVVACRNEAKGPLARAACKVACIGCGKCVRTCPNKAITLVNNRAEINQEVCTACGACIEGCPTGAILKIV